MKEQKEGIKEEEEEEDVKCFKVREEGDNNGGGPFVRRRYVFLL